MTEGRDAYAPELRRGDSENESDRVRRWQALAYIGLALSLFTAPYLGILYFGAHVLTLANESAAYRFLYSDRLLDGEGATVWVLAGFLTTAVQNGLLRVTDAFATRDASHLLQRVQSFAWATYAVHVLTVVAILGVAVRTHWISWTERLLLLLAMLGPLYLTRTSGFVFALWPDYLLTNVVLIAAAVCVFQREWHRPIGGRPLVQSAAAGVLAGAMVVNKITMAPFAMVMLVPIVTAGTPRVHVALLRLAVAGMSAAVCALAVLGAFYTFQWGAIADMFDAWSRTVVNPGSLPNFWTERGVGYLTDNGYGYIIALWALASLLTLWSIRTFEPQFRARALGVWVLNMLAAAAWGYFLYKRGAETTFFEGIVALLGLTAVLLTIAGRTRMGQRAAMVVVVVCAIVAAITFEYRRNLTTLRESGSSARALWALHEDVMAFAGGREIVVIHPTNAYGYAGIPEFLLKGSADTPTWDITGHGRRVLDRYAPGMRFRHEYSGASPASPLPAGVVVYWVDVPRFPPLVERYPILRRAEDNPHNAGKRWAVPSEGGTWLTAHAVMLNEPAE